MLELLHFVCNSPQHRLVHPPFLLHCHYFAHYFAAIGKEEGANTFPTFIEFLLRPLSLNLIQRSKGTNQKTEQFASQEGLLMRLPNAANFLNYTDIQFLYGSSHQLFP